MDLHSGSTAFLTFSTGVRAHGVSFLRFTTDFWRFSKIFLFYIELRWHGPWLEEAENIA